VKAGAITESERDAWLRSFHEQGTHGPIIAGRLHIFVWGWKAGETVRGREPT